MRRGAKKRGIRDIYSSRRRPRKKVESRGAVPGGEAGEAVQDIVNGTEGGADRRISRRGKKSK